MIDTHCHINDEAYAKDPSNYIKEGVLAGVSNFVVVGCDLKSSVLAAEFSDRYKECYSAVGIHPSDSKNANSGDLDKIEELLTKKNVIAVGEIGLDYYWDKEPEIKAKQKDFFIKQIKLANKYNLPIIIHCRDAIEDILKILKENAVNRGGIIHCYGGSKELVNEFIKLGFYIGIGGVVTFKNAVKLKEVAKHVDSKFYLLETDAPYLAPTPHRGELNHSKYLNLIRDEIANLRQIPAEQVEKETTENFKRLFNL